MYSLMKKIITEKDIRRHVSLVEQLLNHTKITVNELAEIIGTTLNFRPGKFNCIWISFF